MQILELHANFQEDSLKIIFFADTRSFRFCRNSFKNLFPSIPDSCRFWDHHFHIPSFRNGGRLDSTERKLRDCSHFGCTFDYRRRRSYYETSYSTFAWRNVQFTAIGKIFHGIKMHVPISIQKISFPK